MECGMAGELYSLDTAGTKGAPMDITLGLFTRLRSGTNAVVDSTAYLSFADIISDLADADTAAHLVPKYGTIQGDISDNTVDVVTGLNREHTPPSHLLLATYAILSSAANSCRRLIACAGAFQTLPPRGSAPLRRPARP